MLSTRFHACLAALSLATLVTTACDPGPTEPTGPVTQPGDPVQYRLSPPLPDPDSLDRELHRVAPGHDVDLEGDRSPMALRLTPAGTLPTEDFTALWNPDEPEGKIPLAACDMCGSPDGCVNNYEGVGDVSAAKVCFTTCSMTADHAWDLGLVEDRDCEAAAQDFCMWNHLGHAELFCPGWYI